MKYRFHTNALFGLVILLLLCWGVVPCIAQSSEGDLLGTSEGMQKMVAIQTYVLWLQADGHMEAGRTEAAKEKYLEAYNLELRGGNPLGIGVSALEVGHYYNAVNDPANAATWYQRAISSLLRTTTPNGKILALFPYAMLGYVCDDLGKTSESVGAREHGVTLAKSLLPVLDLTETWFQEGVSTLRDTAGRMALSLALHYEGLAKSLPERTKASFESYEKCIDYYKHAGNWLEIGIEEDDIVSIRAREADLAWALGDMYNLNELYAQAIAAYQHAVEAVRRSLGDGTDLECELLLRIGRCHHDLEDDDSAIESLISGGKISVEAGYEVTAGQADDYLMLANLLHDAGRFEEAAYWSGVAANAFEILSDPLGRGLAKYLEGLAFRNAKRYGDAIPCLQEAADALEDEKEYEGAFQHTIGLLTYCRCQLTYEQDETGDLRIATSCVTSEVGEDNCPVDEGMIFSSSDEKVVCWVAFDGIPRGETIRFVFIAPNGFVYHEGTAQAQWQLHWYWIWLKGHDAAMKTGTWTVKIYIDDSLEAEMHFQLRLP